jgi:antitoxin HicB
MTKKKNRHAGSDFDEFLRDEGLLADAEALAIKRVLAYQLAAMMKKQRITKSELARRGHPAAGYSGCRVGTSRAALDRLLDPRNPSVTL